MQPCRGRINVVNLQNKNDGGCFGDLRAMHQRIDIISLLYFFLAGYGEAAADRDGDPKKCRIYLHSLRHATGKRLFLNAQATLV
jgi:hypothetical protein